MTAPVLHLMRTGNDPGAAASYWMWCPACDGSVRITDSWSWNGDMDKPTFQPSILTTGVQWAVGDSFYKPSHAKVQPGGQIVCHSFLTHGLWQFLADCTHDKAGQSMPMVALPNWLVQS